ncbi:MAG: hypothetical protein NT169_03140 [Chloroflexi bacterium]|nr:hypothetical protein [Chloroflexota bacterium]
MGVATEQSLPRLGGLPTTLPKEGAVSLELVEGAPVFRASAKVQTRIETLLDKQKATQLSQEETRELDRYEDFDDYLSYLNRLVRNLLVAPVYQGTVN